MHSYGSGFPEASIGSLESVVVIFSSDGTGCAGLGNRCGFPEASIGSLESVFVILSGDGIGWAGLGKTGGKMVASISRS